MPNKANLNFKEIISWCLFDFASSSYSAVIAAVVFPVYYANKIAGNTEGVGDLWWGRAISLSMLIVAIISPFLGGIADYSGIKKRMLSFFVLLCALSVSLFSFLKIGYILEGFFLIVIANIGMEGAVVFYNSFLPIISPREYLGRVSAWGFGVGYLGSIISLFLALILVKAGNYNLIWLSVSLFFVVFSLPLFLNLPEDKRKERFLLSGIKGMKIIIKRLEELLKIKELRNFLFGYFIYADGINTVIVFSSIFAGTTLGFNTSDLVKLFIIVQLTALIGSFGFARMTDIKGPKFVIILSLFFWILVTMGAYFVESRVGFFIIASIAGLGLGTIQSASRALYSYFIPKGSESEYFGVYSFVGKTSSILGPILFGQISNITGSQRPAIISVSTFFIIGLIVISKVKLDRQDI